MSVVLEERDDLLIVLQNSKVETLPLCPYTVLKHKYFHGNRIIYKFNSDMEVTETYTDGIFNCSLRSENLQIRRRDDIARAITQHYEANDCTLYEEIFATEYAKHYRTDLLMQFLQVYDERVNLHGDAFVIDGIFRVDQHGNAYVRDVNKYGWKNICIVVQGKLKLHYIDTPIGSIQLDETALTIIAKITFLLFPNLEDIVFAQQLPDNVKRMLKPKSKQESVPLNASVL